MSVPDPRDVLFTVTVDGKPIQTFVAEGDVNTEVFGLLPTLNEAVLLLETAVVQPEAVASCVIVTVVAPAVARTPAGIVKVPEEAPIVSVAVLPVEVLAPLRL